MADLSDLESWRSSHGYDTESESVLVDESRYDSNDPHNLLDTDDDDDDDGHDADTDSESDGGLFVPPHSPSPGPSVISLLSASESGPDDGAIYHQLYFDNLDPADEEDLAREELQRELEEIIPELRGHVNDARLGLPQLHPRWSEDINEEDEDEHLDLFGEDDFDGTDDDGLDDDAFEEAYAEAFEEDEDEDEEGVNGGGLHLPLPHIPPSHHHHPLHHLFHYPRLPTVHPDIVLGVNPLQHLGPRLNFLPPHLHEHLQRASLSPALPPLHRARMDRSTRSRNAGQARQRDELVNVELAGGSGSGRSLRGRSQNQQQGQRAAAPDVIDLTGDDAGEDNGDLNFEAVMEGSQNVRRQQSQRRDNAPRLNRSDSNYMGHQPQPPVIDISSDSEDDPLQARPALSLPNPANNHARHHHHRHVHHHHHLPRPHHHHHAHWPPMDGGAPRRAPGANNARGINNARGDMNPRGVFGQLIDAVISGIGVNTNRGRDEDLVMIAPPANFPPMPAPVPNIGPIQFNYAAQPFAPGAPAAGPQKPPHEPPPKARDGFTRDTGEDQVVICPSCNEELAYDPDDEDEKGPPTKKARTKKDRAEHHFWAVKDCGHVFCKKCFDNRRSTSSRNAVKVGFKHCPQNPKKILCAVDGCNTDVSGKASWVGLFL